MENVALSAECKREDCSFIAEISIDFLIATFNLGCFVVKPVVDDYDEVMDCLCDMWIDLITPSERRSY